MDMLNVKLVPANSGDAGYFIKESEGTFTRALRLLLILYNNVNFFFF
jgi:hypothetical protein